jgi:glutaredoxin
MSSLNYPHVTMFIRPGCPYCQRAEDALRANEIPYKTRLMDRDRAGFRAMLANAGHGHRADYKFTVPQIFVHHDRHTVEHIGGCNDLLRILSTTITDERPTGRSYHH